MSTNAAPPIWDFVLSYYRQQGVSEAAIKLQDAAGIDVNMILFLMWLSGQGKALAESDTRKLSEASHGWQRSVVVPIRNIRRLLKENAPFVEHDTALAYRKKVQALEIEGEQLQLNGMADAARNLSPRALPSAEQAARDNLATFAKVTGKTFPPDAVETFVRALSGALHGA
ncbi:MAG: TIGR02444 family protein [Xanthobacteraceae bacterium]